MSEQEKFETKKNNLGIWISIVITGLMFYRFSALMMLQEVGTTIPVFWGIAFKGDVLIGATALIVAFALWKYKNLTIWTIAIVWHVLGIKDFLTGLEFYYIEPFEAVKEMGPAIFIIGQIAHLIAIFFLVRNRTHYFK